jgi:hypothetical protein
MTQLLQKRDINPSSSVQAWIIGISAVIIFILISILFYLKIYPRLCGPQLKQTPTTTLSNQVQTIPVTDNSIELQILPRDKPSLNDYMTPDCV